MTETAARLRRIFDSGRFLNMLRVVLSVVDTLTIGPPGMETGFPTG